MRVGYVRGATDGISIEFFLDPVCPFCKKIFLTFEKVFPSVSKEIRQHIIWNTQPWHYQGSCLTTALNGASIVANDKIFAVCQRTFELQEELFSDEAINRDQSMNDILQVFADRVLQPLDIDVAAWRREIAPRDGLPTNTLTKRHAKYSRQNGIHVTPTVIVGGIIDNSISSSFSVKQWQDKIKEVAL